MAKTEDEFDEALEALLEQVARQYHLLTWVDVAKELGLVWQKGKVFKIIHSLWRLDPRRFAKASCP